MTVFFQEHSELLQWEDTRIATGGAAPAVGGVWRAGPAQDPAHGRPVTPGTLPQGSGHLCRELLLTTYLQITDQIASILFNLFNTMYPITWHFQIYVKLHES